MLLGRSLYIRGSKCWQYEQLEAGTGANLRAVGRLCEEASAVSPDRLILIFEPEGMAHESVETPRVNRAVFASLARIRRDHPVVSSFNVGWGIEWPEPAAGGTYSTLLHSELAPGLVHVNETCSNPRRRWSRVWTLYTAIEALLKATPSAAKVRHCIILTSGFSATATYSLGRRSFRSWVGTMSDRDWKTLWTLISDPEDNSPAVMAETDFRGSGIVAVLPTEQMHVCPFWSELVKSGRVESVIGLDELAAAASGISVNHPGNLAAVFPKQHELDRYLVAGSILGMTLFAMLFVGTLNDARRFKKAQQDSKLHWADKEERLQVLKHNEREMLALRSRLPDQRKVTIANVQDEVLAVAAAIPDSLLLRSVMMSEDGSVEIEALVIAPNFDVERTRASLSDYGFVPDAARGWLYDAARGNLKIRGTYSVRQP